MTSWLILTTSRSTNDMSGKYYGDSTLTAFLPVQINASFTSLPVNTSDICSLPMVYNGPNKVQIIQDWPEPRKVKDIQSFLGFANFYHRFIYEYSRIIVLLTYLTHKNIPWNFTNECHSAFNTLKKAFTTMLVPTRWIPDTQITVKTDTSDYALTAILSITTPSGKLHPIAFHSRMFMSPECNYDVHDKEVLAIIEAFTCW